MSTAAIVLVAMTAIAALATAATLPSVSIQKFADARNCSGAVEHHWTVPTETCTATNETHEKDVKAVKMECFQAFGARSESSGRPQHSYVAKVAAPASCAQIRPSPNKTCAKLESTFTLECNKCLAEEYGHHMFDCDAATGSITERIDCDATCATCASNKTYTKGECVHFEVKKKDGRKFERNFEFTGIGQCPVRVLEEMYKDATCKGFPDHFFHWESGKCEAGYVFTCSGTDPRPTWKPRPSGAPHPTRPAAAKEARHHGRLPKLSSFSAAAAAQSEQLARQFFAAYQKKDFRAMVTVAKQLKHSGRQTKHELLANLTVGPSNPWDWIKCEVCKHIISKIAGTIADVGCEAADPAIDAACGLAPPGFDVACAAAFDAVCPIIFNLVVNDHTPINSHLCNDIHWC